MIAIKEAIQKVKNPLKYPKFSGSKSQYWKSDICRGSERKESKKRMRNMIKIW